MGKKASKRKPRRGPRGFAGRRGFAGKRGAPGIEPTEIHAIIRDIERIQDEAALQFKRIAQMQVQLDMTLKALKDMGDRAGRQRKRT
jgi:hypothetical protein